jgi:hypothetical protein
LLEKGGKQLPCLVFDGTIKCYSTDNFSREWPNIVMSDSKTTTEIDRKWGELISEDIIPSPSLRFQGFRQGAGAIVKIIKGV